MPEMPLLEKITRYKTSKITFTHFNIVAKLGLMQMGTFIILRLSGERNFGVRLNKPYTNQTAFDITVFAGNHADLLIIVS